MDGALPRCRRLPLGAVRPFNLSLPFFLQLLILTIRSVHNTRIERLWYDVTQGFSNKWKLFFFDLEDHHSLRPDNNDHIWLLHLLFHLAIEQDCQRWVSHWNNHKISTPGHSSAPGTRATPSQMWLTSQLTDGMRGFEHLQDTPADNVNPLMLQDLRDRRAAEVANPANIASESTFPSFAPHIVSPSSCFLQPHRTWPT